MQAVTLSLALIGIFLILIYGPFKGFIIYIIALFWYPQPLFVSIATIDFSLSRILIFTLFSSIFFRSKLLHEFKINIMDILVMIWVIVKFISIIHNEQLNILIPREGAAFADVILPYFAARIILTTKEKLLIFIQLLVIIAIPLAIFGIYQTITGNNPYHFFTQYYGWGYTGWTVSLTRHGLYRANVVFLVPIAFGLFLEGIVILCLGLWYQQIWSRKSIIICFVIIIFGVFSSMSSAPYFALIVSFFVLACFPFRRYRLLLLIFGLASIIFLEQYSNRHWYNVFDRIAFSSRTANYRIELIKETFGGGMSGHWITGYGYVGNWSTDSEFNWTNKDLTNMYIAILVRYGILGLFPFLCLNVQYYRKLLETGSRVRTNADLWLIFCIVSTLIGWNISMLSVPALEQVNTLYFLLIGICMNMPLDLISCKEN